MTIKHAAAAAASLVLCAALLVSHGDLDARTVKSAVSNQQVAATIVRALGADPSELQAVQKEQIQALPFLFHQD